MFVFIVLVLTSSFWVRGSRPRVAPRWLRKGRSPNIEPRASNSEPDLGAYHVHRGGSPGFTPSPGNLIASTNDTGYVDAGPAGSYYKLSALDVNGNESGYALVTPGTTLAVDDGAAFALALEGVTPNPSRGRQLAVSFTLPVAAPARLELLDVGGRLVAEREVGDLGPGRHTVDPAFGQPLRPGFYLVRLTQRGMSRVVRVAVVA